MMRQPPCLFRDGPAMLTIPVPELPIIVLLIARLRSGAWLSRERVLGYSAVWLAIEIAAFVFCVLVTHGQISALAYDQATHHPAKPATTDFVSFYAAGALADS